MVLMALLDQISRFTASTYKIYNGSNIYTKTFTSYFFQSSFFSFIHAWSFLLYFNFKLAFKGSRSYLILLKFQNVFYSFVFEISLEVSFSSYYFFFQIIQFITIISCTLFFLLSFIYFFYLIYFVDMRAICTPLKLIYMISFKLLFPHMWEILIKSAIRIF